MIRSPLYRRKGAEAWAHGLPISANPYRQSYARDAWRAGWMRARDQAHQIWN
jgi:hypothetical protein